MEMEIFKAKSMIETITECLAEVIVNYSETKNEHSKLVCDKGID